MNPALVPWSRRSRAALVFAVTLLLVPAARATVTNVAYWRLGENDPGALPGLPAETSQAFAGNPLALSGSSLYTPLVSAGAAAQVASTLGISFSAGAFGLSSFFSTNTDNFGMELWVNPSSASGNQCLAYNGNPGSSGWGLYIADGQYQVLFGGVALFPGTGAPVTANVWTHLALVRDSGVNVFFVNGAAVATNTLSPNFPAGSFAVAAAPTSLMERFTGALDEVRVFAFAPGGFTPYDLLFIDRPPAATTTAATSAGTTNGTLHGTVNPAHKATSTWFEWGLTTNYGNFTATNSLAAVNAGLAVTNNLTGLAANTTYHYRVAASNASGLSYGANESFTTATFENVTASAAPGLPGVHDGSVAWGDYDNDGRLDFLLTGFFIGLDTVDILISQLWRNTGSGFVNVTASVAPGLPTVAASSVAWGDYDNDGRLDFLLTGSGVSQLWRNTGGGFTNVPTANLPGVGLSSVAWGDYDNDGRLDFLLTGKNGPDSISQVWRNTGSGFTNVTASVAPGLPGVRESSVAWGDYDNDGRLDFLLTGYSGTNTISQVWRNTGSGFVNVTASVAPGLTGVRESSVAWGDYDNDGCLDFLLSGADSGENLISQLWRNTGGGFVNVTASIAPGLAGVRESSVAWGDYDNDGHLDFLLTGSGVSQLWRNTGSGFTNVPIANLPGVSLSSVAWGDYDNDGRLDFLLTGIADGDFVSQLWRNSIEASNTPPAAPSGLSVAVNGPALTFAWNPASDAQTPTNGLAYHLRVGTTPGGSELAGAMAANSGQALLPRTGALRPARSRILTGLPVGQPIYWSVQAADTALASSPFAAEQTFTLGLGLTPGNGIVTPGDTNGDGVVDASELNAVYATYLASSPWLQMTNVAGLGGSNVTFALSNAPAGTYSVESTTNLVDWQPLGPATPRYLFTDTNAPAGPQRYYRLRYP